jgi:precorrin-2 dehydrogenase/sirohydrochlorin ferrochelatase
MGYLALNIQLQAKSVFIIGGGDVATRKIAALLPAGAVVTVVAPTLTYGLIRLRDSGKIVHIARKFQPGDLSAAYLVIAATNDREVNLQVAAEASAQGILAEITDNPAAGSVISPAVIHQGDLSIAISTNGRAPSLAAAIKRELTPLFGDEYAKTIQLLGAIREKLLTDGAGSTYNKQVLRELAEKLPALFVSKAFDEIDRLLALSLGAGTNLATFDTKLRETT